MDEKTKEMLSMSGISVSPLLEKIRTGGIEAEREFFAELQKLPDDGRFEEFSSALLAGDMEQVLHLAYELESQFRRVYAERLCALFSQQIVLVMEGRWDLSIEMMPEIFTEYKYLVTTIRKYLHGEPSANENA